MEDKNITKDEVSKVIQELKPDNKYIQIDNYIYNLEKLCIVSETDADYEGNTKLYFSDSDSVDFPKPLKETIAFLATKGINVSLVNDEEGFILNNVITAYFDEDGFNVSYTESETFVFNMDEVDESKIKKLFGDPEMFYVELSEEDEEEVTEEYDEDETSEDEGTEEAEDFEVTDEEYLDEKNPKRETYQPKSGVKINHSPLEQQRKEGVAALMSLGLKAIVVTAVIVGLLAGFGLIK